MSKPTELHKVEHRIITAGDTGTPTRVRLSVNKYIGSAYTPVLDASVRVKVAQPGTLADAVSATIAPSNGSITAQTVTATKELIVSPAVAAAAEGTLTLAGAVVLGETVGIGSRVYEFTNGEEASGSNLAVDISGSVVASAGTLTLDTQPTVGDTMTIGTRTYAFVAEGDADNDGEIGLGADLAATKPLVVAAINGTDGINEPNAFVTAAAFVGDDCVLTAIIPGTAGDDIVTTETFTEGTNIFDAGTLGTTTAGEDCPAADAVTALVEAVNSDTESEVFAYDGTGNTVDVVAKELGAAGNSIASTETLSNGSWGDTVLENGADADLGSVYVDITCAVLGTFDLIVSTAPFGPTISVPRRIPITHAA